MSEEAPPEEEDPLAAVASARELLVSDEDSKREEGAASVEKLASDPRCARFLSAHRHPKLERHIRLHLARP
jgi:hypothetical protein